MNSEIFDILVGREKRQIAEVERLRSEMEELENRLNAGDIDGTQFSVEIERRVEALEEGIVGLEKIKTIREMEIARLELAKSLIAEEKERDNEELIRLREEERTAQIKEAEARNEFIDHIKGIAGDDKSGHELLLSMGLAVELPEGTKEWFEQQAIRLWKQGLTRASLECFNQALPKDRKEITDSDDALTLLNRGNLQIELGNFDDGILDLERAAVINPTLPTENAQFLKMLPPEVCEAFRQGLLRKDESNNETISNRNI